MLCARPRSGCRALLVCVVDPRRRCARCSSSARAGRKSIDIDATSFDPKRTSAAHSEPTIPPRCVLVGSARPSGRRWLNDRRWRVCSRGWRGWGEPWRRRRTVSSLLRACAPSPWKRSRLRTPRGFYDVSRMLTYVSKEITLRCIKTFRRKRSPSCGRKGGPLRSTPPCRGASWFASIV